MKLASLGPGPSQMLFPEGRRLSWLLQDEPRPRRAGVLLCCYGVVNRRWTLAGRLALAHLLPWLESLGLPEALLAGGSRTDP